MVSFLRVDRTLLASNVGVKAGISSVGRFRTKEEYERQHCPTEDGDEIERPLPSDRMRDLAHEDRREEGTSEQGQIRQRHSLPALMDKEQVRHRSVDQSLERCEPNALNDPRPEQALVVRPTRTSPGAAHDYKDGAQQIEMPFAPDSCRCHKQKARHAHSEQVITGQQGHLSEIAVEYEGEGQGIRSEQRAERGCDDGDDGEDDEDAVAFP